MPVTSNRMTVNTEIEIYMNTDRRHYMAGSADSPLQHAAP
jgi:hypothetical protein